MLEDRDFIEYIYGLMCDKKIIFTYLGDITPNITNSLLKGIKKHNNAYIEGKGMKKRIYTIIVECLENICRHAEASEEIQRPSIFMLGRNANTYYIVSGNYVYNEQIPYIKQRLDQLNSMDKEEMKAEYRKVLSKGQLSDKGGAGLGMFDIAIKSENKLEYVFIPVKDNISFYILKTQVAVS